MDQQEKLARLAENQMNARRHPPPPAPAVASPAPPLRCEMDAEGAIALYGLAREPIVLTPVQWRHLLDHADEICACIDRTAADPPRIWEDG